MPDQELIGEKFKARLKDQNAVQSQAQDGTQAKDQPSAWLCDWFISRRKFKGDAAGLLELNYFEAGLLTSLEVIEFISDIEDRFGIHFSEKDFQDPRFVTVSGLERLITEKAQK